MGLELEVDASIRAPIGAWTPTSAKRQTKLAFERTVKNYRDFDTLDQYIIQVDKRFIRRILNDEAVAARIEQIKGVRLQGLGDRWSVFMITGIIVARGAKGKSEEDEMVEAMSPNATNVANSASIDVPANFANQNNTSLSTEKTADFVWAVRLQKIWKGATEIDWKYRTVSKGAIAGIGYEKPWKDRLQSILSQELSAVGTFQAFDLSEEQGMIVCLDPYTPAERDRMSLTTNGCV
ncbi:uncharacterized protein TrAtP1_007347 [Trichoderma atroviride]|nr:hypothetical protein TrAtP1_007347 [Trichoderma atroviride]